MNPRSSGNKYGNHPSDFVYWTDLRNPDCQRIYLCLGSFRSAILYRRGQRLVGAKKARQQCAGVRFKRFCDLDKFNDIQFTLAPFIFGHEGLRAVETRGNVGLRELPGFPDFG